MFISLFIRPRNITALYFNLNINVRLTKRYDYFKNVTERYCLLVPLTTKVGSVTDILEKQKNNVDCNDITLKQDACVLQAYVVKTQIRPKWDVLSLVCIEHTYERDVFESCCVQNKPKIASCVMSPLDDCKYYSIEEKTFQ